MRLATKKGVMRYLLRGELANNAGWMLLGQGGQLLPRFCQMGRDGARGSIAFTRKLLGKTLPFGLLAAAVMFLTAPDHSLRGRPQFCQ
jgi:hypothetical protein